MKKLSDYLLPGEKDSRINVTILSPKTTIITAIAIMFYSGILLSIYDNIEFTPENSYLLAASILTLILVVSICIASLTSYVHYIIYTRPLLYLAQAAKEVATGNYSIQIPPHRTDGKIDEIDALYLDFNSMVKDLDSTEILKSSFISNISHELKTPIAVISNYSTLLLEDNITDEERNTYIAKIHDTTIDLSQLISNILQISKLDNHQLETNITEFNLSEDIIQCILGYELPLDNKNIDLELNLIDDLYIKSDEGLLKIVVNNLLSNAIKFTPENGEIKIDLIESDSSIQFAIKDNGCGMDEDTLKHIFDKFYQGDSSHKTKGNGLGLAMVKQIIELLNGSLKVTSTVNVGSTFTITIPNN
ncbi:MAG: HAMP domain-containing histidine kinase [Pseudobutyrivibrio sp.]|nr:HAMP domain-containing histidine kinase [Pseudobutyrivibrio sp.]